MAAKQSNESSRQHEFVKVSMDRETEEPTLTTSTDGRDFGEEYLVQNMRSMNALFKTENPIDQSILNSLYFQCFNEWSKRGDYSLRSSLKQIQEFAFLMQTSSCAIKKVSVEILKDPHAAKGAVASALLAFDIHKRS